VGGDQFMLVSNFEPRGDQPQAIGRLTASIQEGNKFQTLLGVTGSGKTFTVANVIARVNRPVLVMSHNKTLAAQLYSELKQFFPHNAVEYFVSYYDYYQPEAYIPQTDTYIEKDSSINEEIERLRLSTTSALMSRRDVIVVASVSCIYGLGSPSDYLEMMAALQVGQQVNRDEFLTKLVDMQYTRNEYEFGRGMFRVRGDIVEVFPSYQEEPVRIEFFGDEIDRLERIDPLTGKAEGQMQHLFLYPAKHFVTPYHKIEKAILAIREELEERVAYFERAGKLVEAQRIRMRTEFDLEMLQEMGFCTGIENYSRHISGRDEGQRPFCLLDFFPDDFLCVIDESHVTVPQVQGMYHGDRSRKTTLVEHGFRLPSALDNRPLNFEEYIGMLPQALFLSATPGPFELQVGGEPVEQVIRPTGLLDPEIEIRPLQDQVDDLLEQVRQRAERGQRTLVTTLTKRTSEDLADYMRSLGVRVRYMHSEIDAIERVEILRGLREAEFDCLIGINLLREGLDLPEVGLVAILDADKEGFLRSETSMIQTAGRAARNLEGKVILYAEKITQSMQRLIDITEDRRKRQLEYNEAHGITPASVARNVQTSLSILRKAKQVEAAAMEQAGQDLEQTDLIFELQEEMREAAASLEFERAAILRDQIRELSEAAGIETGPMYQPGRRSKRQLKKRRK
jgi:excinuclease ABC subunit B